MFAGRHDIVSCLLSLMLTYLKCVFMKRHFTHTISSEGFVFCCEFSFQRSGEKQSCEVHNDTLNVCTLVYLQ